jgi:hypothetical protein
MVALPGGDRGVNAVGGAAEEGAAGLLEVLRRGLSEEDGEGGAEPIARAFDDGFAKDAEAIHAGARSRTSGSELKRNGAARASRGFDGRIARADVLAEKERSAAEQDSGIHAVTALQGREARESTERVGDGVARNGARLSRQARPQVRGKKRPEQRPPGKSPISSHALMWRGDAEYLM